MNNKDLIIEALFNYACELEVENRSEELKQHAKQSIELAYKIYKGQVQIK